MNAYIVLFSDGRSFLRKFFPIVGDADYVLRNVVLPWLASNSSGSFYVIDIAEMDAVVCCDGTTVEYRMRGTEQPGRQRLEDFRWYWSAAIAV